MSWCPLTPTASELADARPLREVASVFRYPSTIVSTIWPTVSDCLASWGVVFDRWQSDLSSIVLGFDKRNKLACRVGGVRVSACRQIGKTYMFGHLALALCALIPNFTVIWTAQHKNTAIATFRSLVQLSTNPEVERLLAVGGDGKPIRRLNGAEAYMEFKNGSTFEVGARESEFGQGRAGVDFIMVDECQYVTEEAIRRLQPTMNTSPWGFFIHTGNPPSGRDFDKAPAEVFKRFRARVVAGKQSKGAYVEFTADEGVLNALDWTSPDELVSDQRFWDQVAVANPSYPLRTSAEAIEASLSELTAESIYTDVFGVWLKEQSYSSVVEMDFWRDLAADGPEDHTPPSGIGINANLSGRIWIAACWTDGETAHAELVFSSQSDAEVQTYLLDQVGKRVAIKHDSKGIAKTLAESLKQAGYKSVSAYTRAEATAGNATWLSMANEGRFSHAAQPDLDMAIRGSRRRDERDSSGWLLVPRAETFDIGAAIAMTEAVYAAMTTKRVGEGRAAKSGRGRTSNRKAVVM